MILRLVLSLFALSGGCDKKEPTKPHSEANGSATALSLQWVDDYPAALAVGKERNLPVFIDMWAPWCAICADMKRTIFSGDALAAYRDRFVWLSLDRERTQNAPVMARLPMVVSPTYYVIDPQDQSVQAMQRGAATLAQFESFLAAGERAFQRSPGNNTEPPADSAEALIARGGRAAAAGDHVAAAAAFRAAQRIAPEGWSRLPDLVLAHLAALHSGGQFRECAAVASESMERVVASSAAFGAVSFIIEGCAQMLDDAELATALRRRVIRLVDQAMARVDLPPATQALGLQAKRYAQVGLGDQAGAEATARREYAVIKAALARARTPEQALPLWFVSIEVYAFLELQSELLPGLERLVETQPSLYHPKFILSQVYFLEARYEDALKMATEALSLAYGPKKGEVLAFIPEIHGALGQASNVETTRQAVLDYYQGLPPGHSRPDLLQATREDYAEREAAAR